jgi:serine protease Do
MKAVREILTAKASNWAVSLLSVSMLAVAASHWTRPGPVSAQATGNSVRSKSMTTESKAVVHALQDAFVNIADTVEPSVVTISARASAPAPTARPQQEKPDMDLPAPFKDFDFFRRLPRPDGPQSPGDSKGSGVIIRESGNTLFILTNNHVVDGRDRVKVQLFGNDNVNAELVGRDEKTDLAVLKATLQRPLPAGSVATLGNSDAVRPGQWAIAIGSPLGYESTLTVGVISAKGRKLDGLGRSATSYVDLIQTDASINPGNSGGPLVNINGEVVGINVAIAAPFGGQGNIGIGFAIPINTASAVAEQLISQGKVVRGYLGVGTSDMNRELSPELRAYLKVPDGGALCENVNANTPAARAGLKDGDVITKFGDRVITNFTDLEKAVALTKPGSSAPLEVVRDGKPIRLNITVVERPDEKKLLIPNRGPGGEGQDAPALEPVKSKYGLAIRPSDDGKGVRIATVSPDSVAADANLSPGDIVRQVGGTPTPDVASFQKAIESANANSGIVLRVSTPGGLRFVVLRP